MGTIPCLAYGYMAGCLMRFKGRADARGEKFLVVCHYVESELLDIVGRGAIFVRPCPKILATIKYAILAFPEVSRTGANVFGSLFLFPFSMI